MAIAKAQPKKLVVIYEPSITLTAKDFLDSPTHSSNYRNAANSRVSSVVASIVAKAEKNARRPASGIERPRKKAFSSTSVSAPSQRRRRRLLYSLYKRKPEPRQLKDTAHQ